MKKTVAVIIVVMLILSLGVIAYAQSYSTIDGFSSQFVTGDAEVETRVMLYNQRESDLRVYVKVTNNATVPKTFSDSVLSLYHFDPVTDEPTRAGGEPWATGAINAGAEEELNVSFTVTDMEVKFALAAEASIPD